MARTITTECPACFSRFHVTPAQLKQADGRVRCGVCLAVFKAKPAADSDILLAPYKSNPDIDFGDLDLDLLAQQPKQKAASNEKAKERPKAAPKPAQRTTKQPTQSSQTATPQQTKRSLRQKQLDASRAASKQAPAKQPAAKATPTKAEAAKVKSAQQQQLAKQRAAAEKALALQKAEQQRLQQQAEQIEKKKAELAARAEQKKHQAEEARKAKELQKQKKAAAKLAAKEAAKLAQEEVFISPLAGHIGAAPVQLKTPTFAPASVKHSMTWGLGVCCALLLLLSQYLWFERQTLAWQGPFQSLYHTSCQILGCQLPLRSALDLIISQQLVVQDHPQHPEALQIKLILENQANFNQPYPALELIFSDLKGRTVATRRIQPYEYLDINSVDPLEMPKQRLVQIELEILQPGTRAVSYQLALVKPDSGV